MEELQDSFDELQSHVSGMINDEAASSSSVYSSVKVESLLTASEQSVKDDLLGGAGEAYNTLKELADLIQTNEDSIEALEALAVGHVKYDGSQTLTLEQQGQARSNIGAVSSAELAGAVEELEDELSASVVQPATTAPKSAGTAAAGTSAKYAREDHVHPPQTTVSGNAGTATKLATARTISLSGDVTGSTTFDGSANKSIAATLEASGVTAGSYGPSANATPAAGATFSVPQVTVDSKGRVTAASTRTVKIPAAPTSVSGNSGTATKLATARTIDGVDFNGSAAITHYGTCSTAAGTAAKTVAITGFKLVTGAVAFVRFTVTNTAANPTLNINGTGAKAIQYRNAAISAGYLAANRTYVFVYDGSSYELVGDINTDTNTDTKVTQTVTSTNSTYPILFGATANNTATKTEGARFASDVKINPSTDKIYSKGLVGAVTATSYVAAAKAGGSLLDSDKTDGAYAPFIRYKSTNGVFVLNGYKNALTISYLTDANVEASTNTVSESLQFNEAGQLVSTGGVKGALSGNASTATKATQDASVNVITSTYATKTELNTVKTTANNALPKSGGTMTGNLNMNSKNITGLNHLLFSNGAELWIA